MPTTYEVIFLGTLPKIDTTQGNELAENAAGILGTYGTSTTPLSGQVRTLSANDTTEDEDDTYDTDNGGGYDSFRINGGSVQNFDAVAEYNATITYIDGTTATVTVVIFQDVNGNTYLAPEQTANSDQVALTAKPIQSLSLLSVTANTGDMAANRVAGDFISSVDGTANADTMTVGYTDAQGDKVTEGNDFINAGAGNDYVTAGGGNDTVTAGTGNDSVFGGTGADSVDGGDGNDVIGSWGSDDGNDTMRGGTGNDSIIGGAGNDLIYGDDGDDSLSGASGADTIFGGAGNDSASITDDHNTDVYDLGEGTGDQDAVWFSNFASTNGVNVTFTANDAATYAYANGFASGSFSGAEIVGGTEYNDTINAGADSDGQVLYGQGGADSITGGSGNNVIYGGTGADSISSGAGADRVDGGDGSDVIYYGTGTDTVYGGAGDDLVDDVAGWQAGPFNDYVDGGDGNDTIYTGDGSDTLLGGAGNDLLFGEDGNDSADGGAGNDTLWGGIGNDTLIGGAGADSIHGEAGNDVIDLTANDFAADAAYGGDGDDLITSRTDLDGGSDSLYGGAGRDTLIAGAGDLVDGGSTGDDIDTLDLTSAPVYGTTTFTFTASGAGTITNSGQTGTFTEIEVIRATEGADSINATGDAGGMVIDAGAGNDSVFGGSGNDSFTGGTGNDSLQGGAGNDTLAGDVGDDRLFGGTGADLIYGGAGADSLLGGDDADTIYGGAGDTVIGGEGGADGDTLVLNWADVQSVTYGSGSESGTVAFTAASGGGTLTFSEIESLRYTGVIEGSSGSDAIGAGTVDAEGDGIDGADGVNDTVLAGAGNDTVSSGAGNDLVYGGTGNDVLSGGDGNDTLDGGDGDDTLAGGAGADSLVGGSGRDTADYSTSSQGVTVNLLTGQASGGDAAGDTLSGMDNVLGSAFDDVLTAHNTQGNLFGGAGNDTLYGGAGNGDALYGGDGNDLIDGLAGADSLFGDAGNDRLQGGEGNDTLVGGAGNDTLTGGVGNDILTGGDGDDTAVFSGNVTDYTFDRGPNGELIVTSGPGITDGTDTLGGVEYASFNGVTYRVLTGDDSDNQTLQGPADGTPVLVVAYGGADWGGGHATNDVMFGGAGSDTLDGGDGDDRLSGGDDADLLRGDGGNDTLTGGAGNDTLRGGAGNDLLTGGDGADIIELTVAGGQDSVSDFNMTLVDGHTIDQLDVSELLNAQGDPVTWRDVTLTDTVGDGSGSAVLTFPGGERVVLDSVTLQQASGKANLYAMGIPCFTTGTPILTPEGWLAVEGLAPGMSVLTESGPLRIVWTGQRRLSAPDLVRHPLWKPVHFPAGAIGNAQPLRLSPQHAVRMRDQTGQPVLVRARHLAESGFGGARIARGVRDVVYHHVLLERHGVMNAAGAATESFYPGPMALEMLDWPARLQVVAAILASARRPVPGSEATAAQIYGDRVHPLVGRRELPGLTCPPFARDCSPAPPAAARRFADGGGSAQHPAWAI